MTDKEVGEVWALHKLPLVRQLIQKLVEEAVRYEMDNPEGGYMNPREALLFVLFRFGIPPTDWKYE